MNTIRHRIIRWSVLVSLGLNLTALNSAELTPDQKIAQSQIFPEPLRWVGENPPAVGESAALWETIQNVSGPRRREYLSLLEGFVERFPTSPWTPALRANLAVSFHQAGRYSSALRHWESAWESVKSATCGDGKHLGDFVLVNWLPLLSSLGRLETLDALLASIGDRHLGSHGWQLTLNHVRSSGEKMRTNPGIAYRCGTAALYATASALGKTNHSLGGLLDLPSPQTGFAMSTLTELSEKYRLELAAVRRPKHSAIVFPAVVHWRENHYAAIIRERNGRYFVTDPTFGGSRWMSAEAIDNEASGFFMVPSDHVPADWPAASKGELQHVFGKGINNTPPHPCRPECEESCPTTCKHGPGGPPPGSSAGPPPPPPGPAGPPPSPPAGPPPPPPASSEDCCGMPTWAVTEPYLSVWLLDKPMFYQTAKGGEFDLKVTYHSDEGRPDTTNIFNFGPLWSCNWLSYVDLGDLSLDPGDPVDPLFVNYSATNYGAGGGQRYFTFEDTIPYYGDQTTFEKLDNGSNLTGGKIHYPDGSVWTYGLVAFLSDSVQPMRRLFLTQKADPQGRATSFYYQTNTGKVYLTHVVDVDGKTNSLAYTTNSAVPTQVLYVTNRFGELVSFKYDTNRLLTNIVDVVSISSSFAYLNTNGIYILSSFTTPYGQTSFEYVAPLANLFGTSSGTDDINRGIRVTEPSDAKHIYLYRDSTPPSADRMDGPLLPCNYSAVPTNGYAPWSDAYCEEPSTGGSAGFCNMNMRFRNSFYWGPRHVPNLSTTNLLLLTQSDYNRARLRNWLHGVVHWNVGESVGMERDQSADDGTTLGQRTWYSYNRGTGGLGHVQGTNAGPNYVAQILPSGETHFVHREYNHLGFVMLERTTITVGSAIGYRTNRFEYNGNSIDLIRAYDGFDRLVQSNAYNNLHQIVTNWNAVGDKTTYSYNANGQLTGATLPSDLVITNAFDATGYLTNTAEVAGSVTNRSSGFRGRRKIT